MPIDPFEIGCSKESSAGSSTFRESLLSPDGKWVWVYCQVRQCNHKAAVAYGSFAIRWGMDATIDLIRRRFRCGRCGNLGALIRRPSWSVYLQSFGELMAEKALQIHSPDAGLKCMCNLYSLTTTREEIGKWLSVGHNRMGELPAQLTLFPRREAPVVRLAEDGEREMV